MSAQADEGWNFIKQSMQEVADSGWRSKNVRNIRFWRFGTALPDSGRVSVELGVSSGSFVDCIRWIIPET